MQPLRRYNLVTLYFSNLPLMKEPAPANEDHMYANHGDVPPPPNPRVDIPAKKEESSDEEESSSEEEEDEEEEDHVYASHEDHAKPPPAPDPPAPVASEPQKTPEVDYEESEEDSEEENSEEEESEEEEEEDAPVPPPIVETKPSAVFVPPVSPGPLCIVIPCNPLHDSSVLLELGPRFNE